MTQMKCKERCQNGMGTWRWPPLPEWDGEGGSEEPTADLSQSLNMGSLKEEENLA